MIRRFTTSTILLGLICLLFPAAQCLALRIDTVYPSLGEVKKPLNEVSITGDGFLPTTRVSMGLDTRNKMNVVSSLELVAEPWTIATYNLDIALTGNTVLVPITFGNPGAPTGGKLFVMDVSDPTKPAKVELQLDEVSDPAPCSALNVIVKNNYAYVAAEACGLKVIDISDPSNPEIEKTIVTESDAMDVAIMNRNGVDYALVAEYENGLEIINLSNESQTAKVDVTGRNVIAHGDKAYVTDYGTESWLTIIDLNAPGTPLKKGSVFLHNPQELTIANQYVYVADGYEGLKIVDVSNSNSPEIVGELNTLHESYGVAVDVITNRAYVADREAGMLVVDIIDPKKPELFTTIIPPSHSLGPAVDSVMVSDGLAYVVDVYSGLHVIDVHNPLPLTLAGRLQLYDGDYISDIGFVSNMAYLSIGRDIESDPDTSHTYKGALLAYDVADPANPKLKGSVYLTFLPQNMVIKNNMAYIVGNPGDAGGILTVVNLSTMKQEDIKSSLPLPLTVQVVDVSGDKAYLAGRGTSPALVVVELKSGANYLKAVGQEDISGFHSSVDSFSLDVADGIAYLTRHKLFTAGMSYDNVGYLFRFDVSDPYNPDLRGDGTGQDLDYDEFNVPKKIIVQGSTAYVADGSLEVIDVSDVDNPVELGSWSDPDGQISSIYLSGIQNNRLYGVDSQGGVFLLDISNPAQPVLTAYVAAIFKTQKAEVNNGYAYVQEWPYGNGSQNSISIVPLPLEGSPIKYVSDKLIKTTLPATQMDGNYTVRVLNDSSRKNLAGAVTFTDEIKLLSSKAIIVAGGGPNVNNIWTETKAYANQAYDNLIYQGYKHEDIYYITDQYQPLHNRYDPQLISQYANVKAATNGNLAYAIKTWAKNTGASGLLVYMVDHGESERFLMRGGNSPQYLSVDELDNWLDDLQGSFSGKVTLIYDACYSGSYISSKFTPPSGKTRITLTSSSPDQVTYFLSNDHSFSSHFWSTFSGKTGNKAIVSEALDRAKAEMASYQTAQLDVNGNGVPNQQSDFDALKGHEGTIYSMRRQYTYIDRSKPVVGSVPGNKTLNSSTGFTLWAKNVYDFDGDDIKRVWVEIIAPDANPEANRRTVTSLPDITLTGPDGEGKFQKAYSGFTKRGTYIVTYYGEDEEGIYSLPKTSWVRQTGGTIVTVPDKYEVDDTYAGANVIIVNDPAPQNHSFHTPTDMDWVKFYGKAGTVYTIKAEQPTIISNPVINIYGPKGYASLNHNKSGMGSDETLSWQCPTDGIYYIKMTNASSHYGANVRYKLKVYNPIAFSLPGYVKGKVTSSGQGVAGAVLRAGGGTAVSQGDGSYLMSLPQGSYGVSVSKAGYSSASFSVTVPSGGTATRNVALAGNVVNVAPTINGSPLSTTYTYEWYSFTPVAADPNGDKLTFSITGKPGWASFNTNTGVLSGLPTPAHIGSYGPYTISVNDGKMSASLPPFTIYVEQGSNLPPTIGGSPPKLAGAERLYSFAPGVSDPNGDKLTLSITGKPGWAAFAGGKLSGVPGKANIGKFFGPITIRVTDSKGAFAGLPGFFIQVVPDKEIDKFGVLPGVFLLLQE